MIQAPVRLLLVSALTLFFCHQFFCPNSSVGRVRSHPRRYFRNSLLCALCVLCGSVFFEGPNEVQPQRTWSGRKPQPKREQPRITRITRIERKESRMTRMRAEKPLGRSPFLKWR